MGMRCGFLGFSVRGKSRDVLLSGKLLFTEYSGLSVYPESLRYRFTVDRTMVGSME